MIMIKSKVYLYGVGIGTLLLLFFFNTSTASQNEALVKEERVQSIKVNNDSLLVLNIETHYGAKVLCVSFNGNEGVDGTLQIKQGATVFKTAHFELIKQPYYASVDISNLAIGTYEVTLTTASRIHTSAIIIQ
jgi:hypothetical protein